MQLKRTTQITQMLTDAFDLLSQNGKKELAIFISSRIWKRDKLFIFHAPDDEIKSSDLCHAFYACTLEEQKEAFAFMLDLMYLDQKKAPSTGADVSSVDETKPAPPVKNYSMKAVVGKLSAIVQDEKQIKECFELCTAFERKEIYKKIRDFISSYAQLPPSDLSNEDATVDKLCQSFAACTFDNQLEVFFFLMEKWENSLNRLTTITKTDEARAEKIKELYWIIQNEKPAPLQSLTVPAKPRKRKRAR